MKKIFTILAATMMAASMFAGYGIAVNGTTYYEGQENKTPADPSFQEFMVLGLRVNNGDKLQLWDPSGNDGKGAGWAVALDGASTQNIRLDGDHYVCSQDGCYDFYIKLKYEADQLYVGAASECGSQSGTAIDGQGGGGGGQGGGQGGGSDEGYWYWKGYVDGQDINSEVDGGIFDYGISHIEVKQDGYIFVVYQVHGVPGVQYMAASYVDGPKHATMSKTGNDKLHVPAGDHTLYLYDNGDGTVELSFEELQGKTLMGGGQGIEDVVVTEKAHKVFVNGELRIVRGDKVFDATGRQL